MNCMIRSSAAHRPSMSIASLPPITPVAPRATPFSSFDEGTVTFFYRSMGRLPARSFPGAVTSGGPARSGGKTADGAFF